MELHGTEELYSRIYLLLVWDKMTVRKMAPLLSFKLQCLVKHFQVKTYNETFSYTVI